MTQKAIYITVSEDEKQSINTNAVKHNFSSTIAYVKNAIDYFEKNNSDLNQALSDFETSLEQVSKNLDRSRNSTQNNQLINYIALIQKLFFLLDINDDRFINFKSEDPELVKLAEQLKTTKI